MENDDNDRHQPTDEQLLAFEEFQECLFNLFFQYDIELSDIENVNNEYFNLYNALFPAIKRRPTVSEEYKREHPEEYTACGLCENSYLKTFGMKEKKIKSIFAKHQKTIKCLLLRENCNNGAGEVIRQMEPRLEELNSSFKAILSDAKPLLAGGGVSTDSDAQPLLAGGGVSTDNDAKPVENTLRTENITLVIEEEDN